MKTPLAVGRWSLLRQGLLSLMAVVYPETCVGCGAERGDRAWCPVGPLVPGLRRVDATHLCGNCAERLTVSAIRRDPGNGLPPVHAASATHPDLVRVLGAWKYQGVRGLAWPLAGLLTQAVRTAVDTDGEVGRLVPVPLHRRRRRERGFNQAEVLARLVNVGPLAGLAVDADLLQRTRATGQQAKLADEAARRRNVNGAFRATRRPRAAENPRVGLVDDLVTGGATAGVAAAALRTAGWTVVWVAAMATVGLGDDEKEAMVPAPGERTSGPG